jgi:outer membrane protein OmpU
MNIKKIGMTALAASLVSTSVYAGELTATGGASLAFEGHSGTDLASDSAFSMGDSVTLSGSTELDNGITVTMAFELDGDSEASSTTSAYDDNSLTLSSDAMGTLKFSAHGGSSASSAMDGTAAGDMWDNFDTGLTSLGAATKAAGAGENSFFYTTPTLVDGLAATASLNTAGASGNNAMGFGVTYTGVEGLSLSYGTADINAGLSTNSGDQTVMKASYAFGSVTLAYTNSEYKVGTGATQADEQEVTSYAVSYTVSDALSVTYGIESISSGLTTDNDAEYEGISAAYTAGGMTLTAKMQEADGILHTTAADEDYDYWSLGLSFAF